MNNQSDTLVTTIDLLRHGQCEGGEIFRGSSDVVLTPLGWTQMQTAISGIEWTHIISSPMLRCRQFAQRLAEERSLELSICDPLREIHFGDWEGQLHSVIQKNHGEQLRQFWDDPVNATPPNGETIIAFKRRVVDCFNELLEQYRGQQCLLVSHGAVIRVLMCELLHMPLTAISNIAVPYASLTRFQVFETEGRSPWVQLCFHRGDTNIS